MNKQQKPKYTLAEFISAMEEDDFNNPDPSWTKWANDFLNGNLGNLKHEGDCTNLPMSCPLCTVQMWLEEYRDYFFNDKIPE